MNHSEEYLDQLFSKALEQAPKSSFNEVRSRFNESLLAEGTVFDGNGVLEKLFYWKVQISILATIVVSGLVLLPQFVNDSKNSDFEVYGNEQLTVTPEVSEQNFVPNKLEDSLSKKQVLSEKKEAHHQEKSKFDHSQQPSTTAIHEQANIVAIDAQDSSVILTPPNPSPLGKEYLPPLNNIPIDSLLILNHQNSDELSHSSKEKPEVLALKTKEVSFTITEHTYESDFNRMAKAAKQAGIDFWFRVHHQKKRKTKEIYLVRDFDIKMSIPGTTIQSIIEVKVKREEAFKISIGWTVDENGKAINLCESIKMDTTKS